MPSYEKEQVWEITPAMFEDLNNVMTNNFGRVAYPAKYRVFKDDELQEVVLEDFEHQRMLVIKL